MKLVSLPATLSVCRMDPGSKIPDWALQGDFFCVARTPEELSIVCESNFVPNHATSKIESGWRAIKVLGPLDFGLTGILASMAQPLAVAKISIFAISTFDTDYVLVKEDTLESAEKTLRDAGFTVN